MRYFASPPLGVQALAERGRAALVTTVSMGE